MPLDLKYGEVEMEKRPSTMKDDEPVFILRAQDILALPIIARYENLYRLSQPDGFDSNASEFLSNVRNVRIAFEDWQRNNKSKLPD